MIRLILVALGVSASLVVTAQVENNSFKDRIPLIVDAPLRHSTTAKATVEWACVNKALTNKCLVYHNDQWFYFTLETPGDYYLNISGQKCRDNRGVQVLIIEGNPCETPNYRILECVSRGLQSDVFIPLQSLRVKTLYLINIDGFLGDYCDFDIQIATKPLGLPLNYNHKDTLEVKAIQKGKLVQIRWVVPKEKIETYSVFKIYKKRYADKRTSLNREMIVERNAYGEPVLRYSFLDTLSSQGEYVYTVFGIHKETLIPFLVSENRVSYFEKESNPPPQSTVIIPLQNSSGENFDVMVYDHVNSSMLAKYKAYVDPTSAKQLEVDLSGLLGMGLKAFMIQVSDLNTGAKKEYYYRFDKGKLIKE